MSSEKTIYTIPEDVYQLFEPGHHHIPSEKNLDDFTESLKSTLRERLALENPAPIVSINCLILGSVSALFATASNLSVDKAIERYLAGLSELKAAQS